MTLLRELPRLASAYYLDDFHRVLVKQFPYFIEKELYDVRDINGSVAEIYTGDFHGLLLSLQLPYEVHRVNTEFNNLLSPLDYAGEAGSIRILRINELEKIAGIYKTRVR